MRPADKIAEIGLPPDARLQGRPQLGVLLEEPATLDNLFGNALSGKRLGEFVAQIVAETPQILDGAGA